MPRVVVVAPDASVAERLAQQLGGAGGAVHVVTLALDDPAPVAPAPADVVILSGRAGDDPRTAEGLAAVVRRLLDEKPAGAAPGRPSRAAAGRSSRHRLANHLAGVVTALVVLERQLDPAATAPAETLRSARAYAAEILGVLREALALVQRPLT